MFKRSLEYLLLSVVIGCAGCATGIKVTHVTDDQSVSGNPWNLPMTQFNLTITRHVTGCGEGMKGSVEVIATPAMVLDEQQRYVLESNGWWATSDITSNLAPSGVSTGLNAQSTDLTATVISNVVATFGQLLVGGASAGALFTAQIDRAPTQLCAPKVLAAVNELYPPDDPNQPKLKDKVDKNTAALAATTAKVTLLTAQAQADKNYKKTLAKALKEQSDAQDALANDQKELTKDINLTSDTQVVSWPLKAAEFRKDAPYDLSEAVFRKWTGLKTNGTYFRRNGIGV